MKSGSELSKKYYSEAFSGVQYTGSLGWFSNFYHKKLDNGLDGQFFSTILEIGSGKGEHVSFIQHGYEKYELIDANSEEPFVAVPKELLSKLNFTNCDANVLPFSDEHFDRCLATCVLLHVSNLEKVLLELRRVTKPGGLITLYLPCDPGIVYRWIRHWISHKKQSTALQISMLETKYLWSIEHRNHFLGVLSAIKYIFEADKLTIKRFPFPKLSWNLNLFLVITIIKK
jgi:ubiquinone/menaquinone biosynthesis C-methylase UbiE